MDRGLTWLSCCRLRSGRACGTGRSGIRTWSRGPHAASHGHDLDQFIRRHVIGKIEFVLPERMIAENLELPINPLHERRGLSVVWMILEVDYIIPVLQADLSRLRKVTSPLGTANIAKHYQHRVAIHALGGSRLRLSR